MIGRIWDPLLAQSLGPAREEGRRATRGEVEHWCARRGGRGRHPGRVQRAGRRMKFGVFYEHQLPRPWEEGERVPAPPGRARAGRAGRPPRLRRRVGGGAPLLGGVQPLVGPRGLPRAPPASAPRTSASGTASSRPRPATTIRPARPSGWPRWTCSRADGSSSARASRVPRPSSAASWSIRRPSATPGSRGCEVALRCMTETPFTGVDGTLRADAAAQRRAQADAEAAPAAVGGLLAARHHPAGGREGDRRARPSPSSTPRRRSSGCRTTSAPWPSRASRSGWP